jgi:ribonuclease G
LSDLEAELGLDGAALIVRTAADPVPASLLRADAQRLAARWQQHRLSAAQSTRPRLILAEPPLPQRVLRDSVSPGTVRVVVDDPRSATEIRSWCDNGLPGPVPVVELSEDPGTLFQRRGVEAVIAAALLAAVPLPSGGNLVIERTQAMITVDVNTGAHTGRNDLEQTLLQTNLEAAAALPRQLRLRALGGIIAIDFIDMRDSDHRRAVLLALKQALDEDPDAGAVTSVGKLGLVVLTRRQTRPSLAEMLTAPCSHCNGSGRSPWPTATTL